MRTKTLAHLGKLQRSRLHALHVQPLIQRADHAQALELLLCGRVFLYGGRRRPAPTGLLQDMDGNALRSQFALQFTAGGPQDIMARPNQFHSRGQVAAPIQVARQLRGYT